MCVCLCVCFVVDSSVCIALFRHPHRRGPLPNLGLRFRFAGSSANLATSASKRAMPFYHGVPVQHFRLCLAARLCAGLERPEQGRGLAHASCPTSPPLCTFPAPFYAALACHSEAGDTTAGRPSHSHSLSRSVLLPNHQRTPWRGQCGLAGGGVIGAYIAQNYEVSSDGWHCCSFLRAAPFAHPACVSSSPCSGLWPQVPRVQVLAEEAYKRLINEVEKRSKE